MSGGKTCCGGACMTKSGCSLLTWKDPIISGKIFGALIGSLLFIKYFNIFTVFFYTSAVALAGKYSFPLPIPIPLPFPFIHIFFTNYSFNFSLLISILL